ncbi:sn-glycerol-1-phosphate dehydrogenase [Lujinxingia vulgaris]|uniref:sn-glycerol-1-phosphate dehydrogenase n=1 Tax=Lujinxingia vulgaris TaxID=2600176 RepID=A0A5C6X8W4_9DELT|nr:iron-containing alcohol dehydrogenase [Lujinxingia vulgaris]TXD33637.1 sn-glycerol-1-phosphate dehydrogenase [Lujinxingia vulgaris]
MTTLIDELLTRYAEHLDTRAIVLQKDAIAEGVRQMQAHLPEGTWLVAFDENTWEVAGKTLAAELDRLGQAWERFEVTPPEGEAVPRCDDEAIAAYQAALGEHGAVAGVAVGAGTINDIVKQACFNVDLYMACVATSPSMNGYTSGIAAVLSEGVKTTIPCRAPRVVVADLDVLAESPYRMICSGLGDLMSKPVSNADWQLSAWLNGTFHSAEAMEIIEAGAKLLDGVAPKLPSRDRQAVGDLSASLMLSGLAMSVAGSSSPASGGEHLISHFIDMTSIAFDEPHDFHGCQVGVGTLTTAYLYEQLMAMDPDTIDVEARVAALQPWEDYAALLKERFGPLYEAVVKHAEKAYPSADELRARLTTLKSQWSVLRQKVGSTLRTCNSLEEELVEAKCPVRFADLDVARERAWRAVAHSKDIRNRYTILHLAWELGTLDAWTDKAIDRLYDSQIF